MLDKEKALTYTIEIINILNMLTSKQKAGEINSRTITSASMLLKVSRILKDISARLTAPELGDVPENFLSIAKLCDEQAESFIKIATDLETPVIEHLQKKQEFGAKRHQAIIEHRRYE